MANNVYLASKPRYEILDGLRGVAAILIVIFHLWETYSNVPGWKVLLAFIMGCLMIPCGPKMDIRGWGENWLKRNKTV